MKRNLKKTFMSICLCATIACSVVAPLATTKYPSTNDIWKYGTETVYGTKYTYSDYLNFNNVNWYTASVTDKKGTLRARVKRTDGRTAAHARWTKKSGNEVWYNYQ